jgi:hypothetical protein
MCDINNRGFFVCVIECVASVFNVCQNFRMCSSGLTECGATLHKDSWLVMPNKTMNCAAEGKILLGYNLLKPAPKYPFLKMLTC